MKKLGRGLSALMSSSTYSARAESDIVEIDCSNILPNPKQPRKHFDESSLQELAASIKTHGIISPIIVRRINSSQYEIVAGERRWRASKIANKISIPAQVINTDSDSANEISIIENIQRENLSSIEEAMFYNLLITNHGYTQDKIANKLGKSRSHISNLIRVLQLPEKARHYLMENKISHGHAKVLLSLDNQEKQSAFADKIIDLNLSVEKLIKMIKSDGKKEQPKKNEELTMAEEFIQKSLNSPTKVSQVGKSIKIHITCTEEGIDKLLAALAASEQCE